MTRNWTRQLRFNLYQPCNANRAWRSILAGLSVAVSTSAGLSFAGSVASADHSKGVQFQRPPLRFEINEGQTDPQVRFTARDRDGVAYLISDGAVFQISRSVGTSLSPSLRKQVTVPKHAGSNRRIVRMKAVGANPNPRAVGSIACRE